MTSTGKAILWIIVILVIIGGIIGLSRGKKTDTAVNKEPIKIGFIAPLTGDAVAYGEPVKKGVEIAEKEINDAGGVNDRPLQVIYEDGKCSNKDATSAAQKLISIDKVKVIIGMICSGELISAAPVAESAKVILIGQGSSPDITKAGDYVFRTFPSDTIVGTALVEQMLKNNTKTVAILSGSTAYTLALKNDFESKVKETAIKIVASESYTDGVKDYRSQLQKIKNANPDAILLDTQTGAEGGRAAQQARDLGITSQFYTAYFSGPEFVKLGKAVEGTYVIDAPSLSPENTKAQAFLAKSKEVYDSDATYPFFSANAYDEVYLIAKIIGEVGEDTEKIKAALYQTKSFEGLSGNFGFDVNGDVTGIDMRVMQIKNGELVSIE
jgi:branched-chain amino acid transport system substrate-binding protein